MVSDDDTRRDGLGSSADTREVDVPNEVLGAPRPETLVVRSGARYRLEQPIGRGGMGEILQARDEQIDREVAVKRMKEKHPSSRAMGRFFREACIQGRLDHPAIVPVHELGVDDDGRPFFAMKKLTGTTLAERIAKGEDSRQRLLRAFADVCLAIEFAHTRGVIHRDIKPHNIVLGDFGEVYVLDWGVAKYLNEPEEPSAGSDSGGHALTEDGTVVGTSGYMSPEQARALPVDGRADVYSLGCVLFEILAGQPLHPRGEGGMRSVLEGIDARPSARVPGRDIPPELDALCVAATAMSRERRVQTAREVGTRVQRYLDGDRDLAMREELAHRHLDHARAAFARGDGEAERGDAMREAGRALALDPKLDGAADLVTRLMLEPPRETPPAVQRLIDAGNLETLRKVSRAASLGYLGFLAFLPVLVAGGRAQLGYAAALAAVILINVMFLKVPVDGRDLRARAIRIALGNAAMIALLARMSSPFLIAPGVAALATMALVFSPTYNRLRAVGLLAVTIASAVLLPWLLEITGVVSSTMSVTREHIVIDPVILQMPVAAVHALLALYVCGLVTAAAGMAAANRRAEREVRNRLHLQAWQLSQLVPHHAGRALTAS